MKTKTNWTVRNKITGRLPQEDGGADCGDVYCALRFRKLAALEYAKTHPEYEAVSVKAAHRGERGIQSAMADRTGTQQTEQPV